MSQSSEVQRDRSLMKCIPPKPTWKSKSCNLLLIPAREIPSGSVTLGTGANQIASKGKTEEDGFDGYLCPADYRKGKIYDDWLNEQFVRKIPYGVETNCLFDCCHSGSMLDLPYKFERTKNYFRDTSINRECKGTNGTSFFGILCNLVSSKLGSCFYLSGCMDKQTAKEKGAFNADTGATQKHGMLTYSFLKTLRSGKDLTTKEFIGAIDQSLTDKSISKQTPQISANWEVDSKLKVGEIAKIFRATGSASQASASPKAQYKRKAAPKKWSSYGSSGGSSYKPKTSSYGGSSYGGSSYKPKTSSYGGGSSLSSTGWNKKYNKPKTTSSYGGSSYKPKTTSSYGGSSISMSDWNKKYDVRPKRYGVRPKRS